MKPPTAYYIQGITLISSSGKHIPLMVLEPDKIMTIPLCTEKIKAIKASQKRKGSKPPFTTPSVVIVSYIDCKTMQR